MARSHPVPGLRLRLRWSAGGLLVGMGNRKLHGVGRGSQRKVIDKLRQQGKTAEELAAAEKTLGPAGEVWCLDEKTGQVQWKFVAGEVVLGAVAAGEGRFFFATGDIAARDGYVYAVSAAGKELGRWNAHAPILASPALSGGLVYVVTETGKLYGLRADDLELAWEATLGFTGPFISSPAVARGHVYVGSQQDGLLCVGKPGGRKQEPCWAGGLGGPGCGGVDRQPTAPRAGQVRLALSQDRRHRAAARRATQRAVGLPRRMPVPSRAWRPQRAGLRARRRQE